MSNNVVSIIVPVYNVAPYLVRCIDSLISQTHRENSPILSPSHLKYILIAEGDIKDIT